MHSQPEGPASPLSRAAINKVFLESERTIFGGQPMRLTEAGIWLPTPLSVAHAIFTTLFDAAILERFGPRIRILDAGMGDGRLVALACNMNSDRLRVEAYGLELSPELADAAQKNLARLSGAGLSSSWRVARGDFTNLADMTLLDISVGDIDLFLSYPDGNEQHLPGTLAGRARPDALIVLATPDDSIALEGLRLEKRLPLSVGSGSGAPSGATLGWQLAVYNIQEA